MIRRWTVLLLATAAVIAAVGFVGLPTPALFGALLAGFVAALCSGEVPRLPAPVFRAGQAVTGVTLGILVQPESLEAVAGAWAPVLAVSAATLGLSLLSGVILARMTGLDRPTAALGMIAGGAAGIVGMSGDLGADDRLVAFMQYARVLVVVLLAPVLAATAFGASGADVPHLGEPVFGTAEGWLLTAAACAVGGVFALVSRLTAGALLGPMIAAAAYALLAADATPAVPPLLRELAFAAIGLQVGLAFTVDAARRARSLALPVLGLVVALIAACFLLALGLEATTDATLLDSYLATTPGGLFAVAAAAFGTGADTTFVVAVQTLRLFAMVLLAPLAVRLVAGDPARRREAAGR